MVVVMAAAAVAVLIVVMMLMLIMVIVILMVVVVMVVAAVVLVAILFVVVVMLVLVLIIVIIVIVIMVVMAAAAHTVLIVMMVMMLVLFFLVLLDVLLIGLGSHGDQLSLEVVLGGHGLQDLLAGQGIPCGGHDGSGGVLLAQHGNRSGDLLLAGGLGAAQEALNQLNYTGDPIALGYACAYPLGVVGIIGSIIAVRYICRINLKKEEEELNTQETDMKHMPHMLHLEVRNEAIDGKKLIQVKDFLGRSFVCSRIRHEGHVSIPNQDTEFHIGDQLFIVCSEEDAEAVTAFIGREIQVDWEKQDTPMVSRRILVTKSEINGKKLGSMHFRSMYGVNVTRINRSGMDLFADPNLVLQVGDRVMVVGQQDAVERVAGVLGNQLKRLDTPNIVTIFVGIFLGILLGSLPIAFPGMPTPVKLGLAGGPLVVAILIGRFGHKMHLVTYTTMSANLMLREIGIVLFLASVGIEAGEHFVQTVVEGSGLAYVGYGFLITTIPLLIIGMIARFYCKVNYFTLMGLIAGSNTDPPALAYSNQASGNDAPSVGYSTVYPLTMFLRILAGQMILLAMM